MMEYNQKIMLAQPMNASSLVTGSIIPKNSAVKIMPKILLVKFVKPQTPNTSVVTCTTNSTQYLTTVPLMNKMSPSSIQLHQSPSIKATSSMQHTDTIVRSLDFSITDSDSSTVVEKELMSDDEQVNDSVFNNDGHFIWNHKSIMLFFSEYEEHEKNFQKRKYQSKEAMFQALAESFQRKGYTNTTKNHIKNKFKLLKKNWDKHIKRTIGKNSSGKGTKSLPYEEEMIKIFEKSHSGVPLFVASRNGIISQKEILQNVCQNLSEKEHEEQREQISSVLRSLNPVTLESNVLSSKSNSSSISNNVPTLSNNNSTSSITSSSSSSLTNTRVKARDGKLALTLQSVKDSICALLEKENDNKQEIRTKVLTELQKCNELQKERNIILEKQLTLLENLAKKLNPIEKELLLYD